MLRENCNWYGSALGVTFLVLLWRLWKLDGTTVRARLESDTCRSFLCLSHLISFKTNPPRHHPNQPNFRQDRQVFRSALPLGSLKLRNWSVSWIEQKVCALQLMQPLHLTATCNQCRESNHMVFNDSWDGNREPQLPGVNNLFVSFTRRWLS